MCGIFGSVNSIPVDLEKNRKSLNTLKHRGPDQQGDYYEERLYIGHRRLSILDLSENGRQPMVSEHVVITVNGEIYNFQQLRNELKSKYNFISNSDSEVVLHGYAEWGIEGLLARIDGMYSIVIYDKRSKKIFLGRDRYGIKPMYYSLVNKCFCWASELKAIEEYHKDQPLEIDYTAVYDYLTYLYVPTPKSLYKNVFKLPPAYYLEFNTFNFDCKVVNYWQLPIDSIHITLDEAAEKVRELLARSVKAQMISDVPLGFFLSGGIDSSTVVALASGLSQKIHTFSIGFDVAEHDETQFARQISKIFNTSHNEKILDIKTANDNFERIRSWYDEPYADTSALPSFLVSEFAKQNSTVVLTGDGGDELFGGYEWYYRFEDFRKKHISFLKTLAPSFSKIRQKNRYSFIGKVTNQLEYRTLSGLGLYTKLLSGMLPYQKIIYRKEWGIADDYNDFWYFEKYYKPDLPPKKRFQYLDFHTYLHDDIFTKVDRVSMSVALECRVPFMEKDLVEFAFSLPEEIIYHNNQKKGLLKYALKDVLPEEILHRKKRGFNIPLNKWNNQFLKNAGTTQEHILSLFHINE